MIYAVLWRPLAENQLADLWTAGPDRQAIAQAADEIDARLRTDPQAQGESRTGMVPILFVNPLAVLFEPSGPDRLVAILKVWRTN
jgi:hypothetical protein